MMIKIGLGILCAVGLATSVYAANKPNIIYINADDLGVMDVGFTGGKGFNTPNLDKLAAEGMIFTDAYAPAANCAPSRAACISGQVAARTGVHTVKGSARGPDNQRKLIPTKNTTHLKDENITIAEALKAGGYATIHLGKWHLGKDPMTQGFDINIGGETIGYPAGGWTIPFRSGPMKSYNDKYPAKTHSVDIFANEAVKFMNKHKDQPFFMHMAYYAVHSPIKAVPEFIDKYKDTNLRPAYASLVEKMDQGIGKIITELDRLGLKDNTLVLFTSDNGGVVNKETQFRANKGSYFEGGIRVPFFISWPARVKAGTKCDTPIIGLDFYPTFLEAAGIEKPAGKILDGVSIMPLLSESGQFKERALFWHFPIYLQKSSIKADDFHDVHFRTRPGSAMRFGKWKFHEYFEDGRFELYDLDADIGERKNLADSMPEKVKQLKEMLYAWRAEVNAPVPTELNPEYDPTAKPTPKKSKKSKKGKKK